MCTINLSQKKRPVRRLVPPARCVFSDETNASITDYLRPALVPTGCSPEAVDPSLKAHKNLLQKVTVDDFDLNRYLVCYKPLARVNAVLATTLLAVTEVEQKSFPMSPVLRSAAMYIVGNACKSLYVMTFATQLKACSRSLPAAEGVLPAVVLEGKGLSDVEVAALDFVQQLSSTSATISDATRKGLYPDKMRADGKLERVVAGTAAYGAFLSCLTSTIDIELTHGAIQYATLQLDGLPWKASGSPINVNFANDDITDFGTGNGTGSSKYKPKRERLSMTRNYDRHAHHRLGSHGRARGMRLVSQFLSTLGGAKFLMDIGKTTENWMTSSGVPSAGRLFDMNDEIFALFGFHPFYLSTTAMGGETMRRALVYGAKELLFRETEITTRLKFIICYVLSSTKERRRIVDSENSRSFEKRGIHNGHSINSVYSERTYDALSIMSAHAAFLGYKYGAGPAELVAASDVSRVRSASEQYKRQTGNSNRSRQGLKFPLSRKECAAVLIAHSLVKDNVSISKEDLKIFSDSFVGTRFYGLDQETAGQRALMEIIGAASMWSCLERYAVATLGFDIDFSSNMVFGEGRAEDAISSFCVSTVGRNIGLSLGASEKREMVPDTPNENTCLNPSVPTKTNNGIKEAFKKRTSSALSSSSRIGRMFGGSGSGGSSLLRWDTVAAA